MAVFILEDALCVWTKLDKHSSFVWLFVSSVKTGTRRIIRPDELSSVVRRSSCTTEDSNRGRINRLVELGQRFVVRLVTRLRGCLHGGRKILELGRS